MNTDAIFIGAGDLSSGMIHTAEVGAITYEDLDNGTVTARTKLDPKVWGDSSGHVSDAGVTLSQSRSTSGIKDWSGMTVRTMTDDFTGTVSYTEIQTDSETMKRMVGDDNVIVQEATADHGAQVVVAFNAQLAPARSWMFSMIDGARRMRIYVPNGQVTATSDTTFANNAVVSWPVTITCSPDERGNAMYLLTDDGQVIPATGTAVAAKA